MKCDQARPLISGLLDGELTPTEERELKAHLEACDACAALADELGGLTRELETMTFAEPTDEELERYWSSVYNRMERRVGWILVVAGVALLACYGVFRLITDFVGDPTVSWVLRAGVCAAILGAAILLVSAGRERLRVARSDRYSKEVER